MNPNFRQASPMVGSVHDGQKACGVRHDGSVKLFLVVIEQAYQADVAVEIGTLLGELEEDTQLSTTPLQPKAASSIGKQLAQR
jgi:hypothetical protein